MRIAHAMEALDLTQEQLGQRCCMLQSQVSRLLSGARSFGLYELELIADVLGITPSALTAEDDADFQKSLDVLLDRKTSAEQTQREWAEGWAEVFGLSDPDLAARAASALASRKLMLFAPTASLTARSAAQTLASGPLGRAPGTLSRPPCERAAVGAAVSTSC